MDGFAVRLQLVSILRKLSSSQSSIQTTVRFLLKHRNRCGEDLWDCLVDESEKASLNARVNILYLIDALLLASAAALLPVPPASSSSASASVPRVPSPDAADFNYGYLIARDLQRLIEAIVPLSFAKKGLLNLSSTLHVLRSWRDQERLVGRYIGIDSIENLERLLLDRKNFLVEAEPDTKNLDNDFLDFSKRDILDRIDDDRERHKRLRERIWVLPTPPISSLHPKPVSSHHPASTYIFHRSATLLHTSLLHSPSAPPEVPPHLDCDATIALECDQLMAANAEDTAQDGLEESDWVAIRFENNRCFGHPKT